MTSARQDMPAISREELPVIFAIVFIAVLFAVGFFAKHQIKQIKPERRL